jgi:hypothetical protein
MFRYNRVYANILENDRISSAFHFRTITSAEYDPIRARAFGWELLP